MIEPLAVARCGVQLRPCRRQLIFRLAPGTKGGGGETGIDPPERIEQRAVAARVEQPAIVVLTVNFDEQRTDLAQQRDRDRLIVDAGAAAAIGAHCAADDQRLARVGRDFAFGEQSGDGRRRLERRGHARAVRSLAHQPAVRARPERKPQRIEQDRLACAGLAGERAQSALELEVERFDQHDVANGKSGEHRSAL